ncbi:hypothetical protein, partial [Stenotrophomonas maltophilia group sp. RNC7]|uniref:hypothetical protein n=1 Tax=Stenotrophomonas maltophilia group sp. RNC7 TaxID=3071467 RepID=UPI0027E1EC73
DKQNRLNRMTLQRGRDRANERIRHDEKNFKIIECDYVVDSNGTVENTFSLVKKIIEKTKEGA